MALVAATEEAVAVEKAGKGAGGVGSAGEAEDIDLVAVVVDLHQVAVGVEDVGLESGTEGETFDHGPVARDAPGNRGVAHGADTWMVVGDLVSCDLEGGVELDYVGVCFSGI